MHESSRLPPLDEVKLRRRLVEAGPYARLVRRETIGSTNLALTSAASQPGFEQEWPHLSVLTAEEQTGARGRMQRSWSSPRGSSLSTSVVLRPALPEEKLSWLSLLAGRALVQVLRERHGVPASLKWPNDVHVEGRKISGILAAVLPPGADGRPGAVLGCGINVLLTESQLPTESSTSVLLERERAGRPVLHPASAAAADLRTELLGDFLEAFAAELARTEEEFAQEEFAQERSEPRAAGEVSAGWASRALRDRVAEVMDTLGAEVRVELPGGEAVRGAAAQLTVEGALAVDVTHRRSGPEQQWVPDASGRLEFAAGDVVHLRGTDRR